MMGFLLGVLAVLTVGLATLMASPLAIGLVSYCAGMCGAAALIVIMEGLKR